MRGDEISLANLLPKKTEICVIGGGIVGVLTALELAELQRNVVLLERGRLGVSQSSRNLGWVRQQGRAQAELPMMIDAHAHWSGMEEKYGARKLRFDRHSISYFGSGERTEEVYEAYHRELASHGVRADLLTRSQISSSFSDAHASWDIGLRTPSDGRVEPRGAVASLAEIANEQGVEIIEGCDVFGIEDKPGGDVRVCTRWGYLDCEKLLIAAGAGTSQLLRQLGVTLPQLSIESTVVEVSDDDAEWGGSGSDGKIAFYRNGHGRIGLSLCEKFIHRVGLQTVRNVPHYAKGLRENIATTRLKLPQGKHSEPQPSWLSASTSIAMAKARRIIGEDAQIRRAWAGEIDILPDFLPAIGTLPNHPSIAVAAGFSGHGFGLAPGVARVLANLLMETDTNHDLAPFRAERFTDGTPLEQGPTF